MRGCGCCFVPPVPGAGVMTTESAGCVAEGPDALYAESALNGCFCTCWSNKRWCFSSPVAGTSTADSGAGLAGVEAGSMLYGRRRSLSLRCRRRRRRRYKINASRRAAKSTDAAMPAMSTIWLGDEFLGADDWDDASVAGAEGALEADVALAPGTWIGELVLARSPEVEDVLSPDGRDVSSEPERANEGRTRCGCSGRGR